ncbi:hypothetical protein MTO96_044611, partial [Rhipicephalus appendiculatus]
MPPRPLVTIGHPSRKWTDVDLNDHRQGDGEVRALAVKVLPPIINE